MSANKVSASLFYYTPPADGSKPHTYVVPPPGVPRKNFGLKEHIVEIENVRGKEADYSLDANGFYFGTHPSVHKDFTDRAEIEKEYYPESIDLIKKITGASKVVLFDHTLRRRIPGEDGFAPDRRGPLAQVHVDQSGPASHARVRRHLPADEAEERLKHRFQIINLWRPIARPAYDWPLALCDFKSVNVETDILPMDLIYPDKVGQNLGVRFSEKYKWKYVRGMTPDEFVLIKGYDSIEDGSVAVFTPHTAFDDPSMPAGTPPRESIEIRALVFYDD